MALLLWSVRMVRTGVMRAFGAALRRWLAASAGSRIASFLAGLGMTGVTQSSTATTLVIVSLVERGTVAVVPALAMVLGADVGTTLIAQILSFGLGWLSPVLLLVGVTMFMWTEGGRGRHFGRVLVGIGLMLLSLRLIVEASAPLREADTLQTVLAGLAGEPLIALLVAAGITWLSHSSLAAVLLVMSLATTGVVPLGLAFVLVLGANVGGAVAPVAITFASGPAARRVPVSNLCMRFAMALAALPLLGLAAPYLALLGEAPARQVANFHTAFNLATALVFLPLVGLVARAAARAFPEHARAEDPAAPRYLDPEALDTPSVALASAARETLRMGDIVESMLARTIEVFRRDDGRLAKEVEDEDNAVDRLHEAIKLYLTRLSRSELDPAEGRRFTEILTFTTNLEHIGDIIDKNLMELARKKIRNRLSFSDAGFAEITTFHARVADNLQLALNVFMSGDARLARRLLAEKVAIRDAELSAAESHMSRLRAGRPETIESTSLHLDVIRDLKRINSHVTSVAYPILEATGELRESRLRELQAREARPDEGMPRPAR